MTAEQEQEQQGVWRAGDTHPPHLADVLSRINGLVPATGGLHLLSVGRQNGCDSRRRARGKGALRIGFVGRHSHCWSRHSLKGGVAVNRTFFFAVAVLLAGVTSFGPGCGSEQETDPDSDDAVVPNESHPVSSSPGGGWSQTFGLSYPSTPPNTGCNGTRHCQCLADKWCYTNNTCQGYQGTWAGFTCATKSYWTYSSCVLNCANFCSNAPACQSTACIQDWTCP